MTLTHIYIVLGIMSHLKRAWEDMRIMFDYITNLLEGHEPQWVLLTEGLGASWNHPDRQPGSRALPFRKTHVCHDSLWHVL